MNGVKPDNNKSATPSLKMGVAIVLLNLAGIELLAHVLAYALIPAQRRVQYIALEDPVVGWKFRGCRHQSVLGYGDFSLCFDDLGLRTGGPRGARVPRLFLGTSITLGQQVPADSTFGGRLNGVNAGFDGYTVYQLRDRYRADLFALEPRHLVLVVGADDLVTGGEGRSRYENTLLTNPMIERRSPIKRLAKREGVSRLLTWRSSQALDDPQQADRYFLNLVTRPADPQALDDWQKAVLAIRADRSGDSFILVLSPPRSQVRAAQQGTAAFPRNEQIRAFCETQGIPWIDLMPALVSHDIRTTYVDSLHYSDFGHALVSAEISARMSQ